jgi:hypothetical protein
MGYGAFLSVVNNRTASVRLFITDVKCMYDRGDQGSNLSLFDDGLVPANSSLPTNGSEYIEAKSSGSCFFDPSQFTVKVEDADTKTIIGHVAFTDSASNWSYSNDNEDVIDVYCNNSGDQARIRLTVEAT